jgi:hypothetical protein
MITGTHGSGH